LNASPLQPEAAEYRNFAEIMADSQHIAR